MEQCAISRGNLGKVLSLYKQLGRYEGDPDGNEPECSRGRESMDDTSSDEEVDVITNSDSEKLECESIRSAESHPSKKSGRSSSCSSINIHVCTYENCDKFFSRPNRLAQHIRTHTGERPYVCPSESCSKSYTRQQHLKRHMEVSHQDREEEKKIECAMCGKMMSNVLNLRKHVNRFHIRKRYDCSECERSFLKQQHLQKHMHIHTGIKPFPCDYPGCEMRCMTPSQLKRHKLTHQKSRYACPQESCQEKFDVYKDLQSHISVGHPKLCDICNRPFRQLRSLKKHRLTHEGTAESYFCTFPACDKYYFQKSNLIAHIKSKHQELNIYECGVCDKRLSSKQKLAHHMTTHDPSYKRNYASEKPRKVRKDKGSSRRDFARLLSGYTGEGEDDVTQTMESESTSEKNTDADSSVDPSLNPTSEKRCTDAPESVMS